MLMMVMPNTFLHQSHWYAIRGAMVYGEHP